MNRGGSCLGRRAVSPTRGSGGVGVDSTPQFQEPFIHKLEPFGAC